MQFYRMTTLLAGSALLTACATTRKAVESGQPYTSQINWPADYTPEEASFFIHNRIDIEASPETVWDIVVHAETWPTWYEGASDVVIVDSAEGVLEADSIFTWKTMGLRFVSTITEFEPPYRLSWESRKWSIRGYHAWLIVPTETGCRVITDESQHGLLTLPQKIFQPNKLRKLHDVWLAEIKRKAEAKENALTM